VPDVVAAGERIGPWGALQSFLMIAELEGCLPLNEALPVLRAWLPEPEFHRAKRQLVLEMAAMTAKLHAAHVFHKDLYLCHFFIKPNLTAAHGRRLTLIDLHRLREHRFTGLRWQVKDLAQLLYSTFEVREIDDHDRARFWMHYRKRLRLRGARLRALWIRAKAARYGTHNGQ
jgi:heptose I phosphotransferase